MKIDGKTVRLVLAHSNIKAADPIKVKPGYTFIFLTEVGFCFLPSKRKYKVFKSEETINKLLTGNNVNSVFANGTNKNNQPIKYNNYKAIYTEGMTMPDHEIEFAPIIGDVGGIFNLPLRDDFKESPVSGEFTNVMKSVKSEANTNSNENNTELTKNTKQKIKNFVKYKNDFEKYHGKVSHRYYFSTKVNTALDFHNKYHKEFKYNKRTKKLVRAGRDMRKMMDKKSEFYIPPGIYFMAGCRTIGDELIVKENGSRSRNSNLNLKTNNVYQIAKTLNKKAKRTI